MFSQVLAVTPASIQSAEHMPRACCLLRISDDCQSPLLLSLSLPVDLLGGSRKENITAAVEGGFNGVLDDTNEETNSLFFFKICVKL